MGEISEMILNGELCQACGSPTGEKSGYPIYCKNCRRENKIETPPPDKYCQYCGKLCKGRQGLVAHKKTMHPDEYQKVLKQCQQPPKQSKCGYCFETFNTKGDLRRHKSLIHPKEWKVELSRIVQSRK